MGGGMLLNLEALAALAQTGDRAALSQLMESMYPLMYRFSLKLCRSPADAQEYTQCTMLKLIENIHKYRAGAGKFTSWAYRVAYNLFLDMNKAKKAVPMEDALLHSMVDGGAAKPDAAALHAERRDEAARLLGCLPDDMRAIVALRYYMDLRYDEIAQALGIPEKKVKWKLHDAKARMRRAHEEIAREEAPAYG